MTDRRTPGWPVIGVVALGGALGAGARYGVFLVWPAHPWATVAINVAGCLAIGFLLGRLSARPGTHPLLRPFAATGVCGGFTTFSTFAVQTLELGGRPATAAAYLIVTVAGGVGAAWAGERLGERS